MSHQTFEKSFSYLKIKYMKDYGCVWFAKKWRTRQNNSSYPVFDL